jgi:hypothetical protein
MFGQRFFENSAFLFTRWSFHQKDIEARKKNNETEEIKDN